MQVLIPWPESPDGRSPLHAVDRAPLDHCRPPDSERPRTRLLSSNPRSLDFDGGLTIREAAWYRGVTRAPAEVVARNT